MKDHPTGIVPIATACRILGVSPSRMSELIADGRFRIIADLPGGGIRDRFIPLDELVEAPFMFDTGRPGIYGPENRPKTKNDENKYMYSKSLADRYLRRNKEPPKP